MSIVTERIDDIEMKQICKEDLLEQMMDEMQQIMDNQLEKFREH